MTDFLFDPIYFECVVLKCMMKTLGRVMSVSSSRDTLFLQFLFAKQFLTLNMPLNNDTELLVK